MEEKLDKATDRLTAGIVLAATVSLFLVYCIFVCRDFRWIAMAFFTLAASLLAIDALMNVKYLRAGRQTEERERKSEYIYVMADVSYLTACVILKAYSIIRQGFSVVRTMFFLIAVLPILFCLVLRLRKLFSGRGRLDDTPAPSDPTAQP